MYISPEVYEKYFDGYQITDCVVRKKDIFYFVLTEMYDTSKDAPSVYDRKKKVITCFTGKPVDQIWGQFGLTNFNTLYAGLSLHPKEQFVGVDMEGAVYAVGGGEKGIENPIADFPDGGPLRGAVKKLKTIDGVTYVAGTGRSVARRDGKNDWNSFTKDIPAIEGHGQGFFDIDGFNANDIYCVGRAGDIWHYDGKKWMQVPFPSNMALWSVCCAGDGYVYVVAQQGYVFKGKGNTWKLIHKDTMTLPFNDMVWHKGKVWCTSDYGLWETENDKVIQSTAPAEMRACAGHLSVGDGVMLLAGLHGAAFHDGKEWQMLVSTIGI